MQPIEKIREILFQELETFREKGIDVKRARAISELSAQTIYAIRVELENKRLELELGKSDEETKNWMKQDFTDIRSKNHE